MTIPWKTVGYGLVGCFLGLLLYGLTLHLWTDHAAIHELAGLEVQRQAAEE